MTSTSVHQAGAERLLHLHRYHRHFLGRKIVKRKRLFQMSGTRRAARWRSGLGRQPRLGVTDERLDEVSDYYRYKPGKGNLWKTTPAKAYAVLEDGKIKQIVVTDPGSGYSTAPKAAVQGMEKVGLKVTVQFNKDFKKNGSISSIEVE
jgi:hypothetical protein